MHAAVGTSPGQPQRQLTDVSPPRLPPEGRPARGADTRDGWRGPTLQEHGDGDGDGASLGASGHPVEEQGERDAERDGRRGYQCV